MSRRLRESSGSRSRRSFGPSSADERRNADLFFADLFGPAAQGLVESVPGDARSAEQRQADLFWADLLGQRPALRRRRTRGASGESTELRQPAAESSFAEEPVEWAEPPALEWNEANDEAQPAVEWNEADEADPSSDLGEAAGSDNVRISLRNDDGTPAAGVAFRAQFRDGNIVNGTLDARGEATIADHTHGDVQVTFPALPAASWEVSSFGGSGD